VGRNAHLNIVETDIMLSITMLRRHVTFKLCFCPVFVTS
jgi:hypothetical protein